LTGIRKAVVFDRDVSINQDLKALFPAKNLDSEYLLQWFESNSKMIEALGTGSTVKGIRLEVLKSITFLTPPLPEQKKIASILTSVDEVIENTQKQIDKLQDLKKATMNELLTKGIGHTEFKDSELGRIPKSWEVVKLENVLDASKRYSMRSGPFGSALLKSELVSDGIPFLGIDNVHTEEFRAEFKRYVTKDKFEELSRYQVHPEDLMITIMGTVGRCCIVPAGVPTALSSKHTWTLTLDPKAIKSELVCWQVNHSEWVLKHFADNSQGGVMASISSETLKSTLVPLPPIGEQEKMLSLYKEFQNRLNVLSKKLRQTQSLKKSLMQDLLTGKVRV
jgi:type I restriction enzyme, S subunit